MDFSKISDGAHTYLVKDQQARDAIAALSGSVAFLGVSSTPIQDGSTIQNITVEGQSIYAHNGNVVIFQSKEFIWCEHTSTPHWAEFGDTSMLGSMAYASSASGSYTPQGNVTIKSKGTVDMSGSQVFREDVPAFSAPTLVSDASVSYDSNKERLTLAIDRYTITPMHVVTDMQLDAKFKGESQTAALNGTQATITVNPNQSQ